jgi:hypothetical protein
VLSSASSENGVTITSTSPDARAVLIAGEPLDQPVVQHGPFVMTTREEIQQTFLDCERVSSVNCYFDAHALTFLDSNGKNGFENAHIWKSKIGSKLM